MNYITPRKLAKMIRESFLKTIPRTRLFFDENIVDKIIECLYQYNPSNQVYLVITEDGYYSDYRLTIDSIGKDFSSGIQLLLNRMSINSTFTCEGDCLCGYDNKLCERQELPSQFRSYLSVRNLNEEVEGELHIYRVYKDELCRNYHYIPEEVIEIPLVVEWLDRYKQARELYLKKELEKEKEKETPHSSNIYPSFNLPYE